jgi:hypothetical protein
VKKLFAIAKTMFSTRSEDIFGHGQHLMRMTYEEMGNFYQNASAQLRYRMEGLEMEPE